jgi:acetylornithine deacetylase/succinyl-diaminopimelate desuccinylase-like protein
MAPSTQAGKPTVYYGARGGAGLEVTVYTAKSAMHSGNYGNWLPDANVRLSQLLASMVYATGKVAIEGFYDDMLPFPAAATKMMQEVPDDSAAMRRLYGLGSTDGAASSLQEGLNLPSFSVHMMKGGEVGGVIAASATAEIALRLVTENSPRTMVDRVLAHIRKEGYCRPNPIRRRWSSIEDRRDDASSCLDWRVAHDTMPQKRVSSPMPCGRVGAKGCAHSHPRWRRSRIPVHRSFSRADQAYRSRTSTTTSTPTTKTCVWATCGMAFSLWRQS